jgi:tripartite-type tricarboxylate transporter receptor subunit TctC
VSAVGLRRRNLLAAASLAWPGSSAWAQDTTAKFPGRAVRLVVPYSVGIGPDVVARSVAEQLSRQWQQPVWVDNKPGASGIVAFGEVRRTPADGHTLFLADTATLAVNPLLHASLPYDAQRDLVPLTLLFRATFLLWTGTSHRWRTLAELQDAARREPGRLSYGTLGNGHASHVAVESYARAADLRFLHVPFKDAGALFNAVVSGDVDFTTFGMNSVAGLYQGGRLRPLAVAAQRRLASHPDIPTLPEAGGPPVEMHPWAAVVALAGTPAPLLEQLLRDLTTAMTRPEVLARTQQAGFEITPSTPQGLRDRIEADLALVRPLLAEGRISRL